MARLLLADDDRDSTTVLKAQLEKEGHTVSIANPRLFLVEIRRFRPHLVLLDVLLKGVDGLEICKQIRRTKDVSDVGVIIVSALASETDRVVGLEVGADDYISKPFRMREVLARVRAVLRRREYREQDDHAIQWDQLRVDPHKHLVQVNGRRIELSALEFRLLRYMAGRPGYVFSRDQLLNRVWGIDRNVTTRNVDVCVRRIREKIEQHPKNPRYIQTIHGVGYRFGYRDG